MAWLTVLGIPAAVYVMCITAIMIQVNEKPQNPLLLLSVGVLTAGIYIFHRTSIIDIEPMQERHRIAIRHKRKLLLVSFLLFIFAIALFALHHPLSTILVFGALAGVVVYGKKTITKPLRLYPYLKPFLVGIAIAMFAWVLNDFSNSLITLLAFIMICSADAFVCDLVDTKYDAASGCQTLATQLGERWTWIIASVTYCFASVVLLFAIEQTQIGLYLFVTLVISLACRKFDARYVVDLRLLLVLLLAWAECLFWIGVL